LVVLPLVFSQVAANLNLCEQDLPFQVVQKRKILPCVTRITIRM
jgi:hypothetical protein